jgi:hypothetical protein
VDGSDEWNLDVFGTIWDGVSLISAGTFLKGTIEFLGIGLVFLWESRLAAFVTGNLPESNHLIRSRSKDVIIHGYGDISDNWDFNSLGSIGMFETLTGTCTFGESSEFFNVFLVVTG